MHKDVSEIDSRRTYLTISKATRKQTPIIKSPEKEELSYFEAINEMTKEKLLDSV